MKRTKGCGLEEREEKKKREEGSILKGKAKKSKTALINQGEEEKVIEGSTV